MDTGTCKMTRDVKILPSVCDSASRLSISAAFDMFQDSATIHADTLGIGPGEMERRRCFWIITRTRLCINRMPHMMDDAVFTTWIQAPERASCERDFALSMGGETLFYGRSIWAVISRETGRLVHMNTLYPEIGFNEAPPDDRPMARPGKKFDDAEKIGSYTVRSVDIDLGGHMNNVNYIRAMLGCMRTSEIGEMNISEIEVSYLEQSYEGDTLEFMKRKTDEGMEIGAVNEAGRTAFIAILRV